jgi:hypothetical protein
VYVCVCVCVHDCMTKLGAEDRALNPGENTATTYDVTVIKSIFKIQFDFENMPTQKSELLVSLTILFH